MKPAQGHIFSSKQPICCRLLLFIAKGGGGGGGGRGGGEEGRGKCPRGKCQQPVVDSGDCSSLHYTVRCVLCGYRTLISH